MFVTDFVQDIDEFVAYRIKFSFNKMLLRW